MATKPEAATVRLGAVGASSRRQQLALPRGEARAAAVPVSVVLRHNRCHPTEGA